MSAQKNAGEQPWHTRFSFQLDDIEARMKCMGRSVIEDDLRFVAAVAASGESLSEYSLKLKAKANRVSLALTARLIEYVAESK